MSPRIKTCYISAPAGANLSNIRDALDRRNVRVLVPEGIGSSLDLGTGVPNLLSEADLVIGVLTRERRSQWVLFELGQAVVLEKQVIVFMPPKSEAPPPAFQGFLTLRIGLQNQEAINFALNQVLSAPERKTKAPATTRIEGRVLGSEADVFLAQVRSAITRRDGRGLEQLVTEAVRQSGIEILAERSQPDHGFDLAIWSDTLQPYVGNPLLIEVKISLDGHEEARQVLQQCAISARAAGSHWSLLLYGEGPPSVDRSWVTAAPTVLAASIADLIEGMRTRPFAELVRDLRNRRVHGEML